jgi:hypothetical protein
MGKTNYRKEKQTRFIEFRDLRWLVPKDEWAHYLKRGFAVRISRRVARLGPSVDIVWEDGKHILRDSERGVEVPIASTWPTEADAIKHPLYIRDPVLRQQEILRGYGLQHGAWKAA